MKILYISNVFPRSEDSSTIYTDLAETMKRRGHDIFIVASDYGQTCKTMLHMEREIPVLRVKTGKMYDVGFIRKGLAILGLKRRFVSAVKKHMSSSTFDFILFESPPVTTAGVVKWAMAYYKCPSYLMLKDIFPQNGVDIGIIRKGGLVHRYFLYKEKFMYKTASIIGCMSEANKRYVLRNNSWLDSSKVEIFPNTKHISYDIYESSDYVMRRKYNVPENCTVAIFGGNMGRPQGLDFFMDVIFEMRRRKDVFFLLVGRGTERMRIRRFIADNSLNNVLLLDALSRDEYEQLIKECDIGLVFLDKRFTIPNFPSRVLSYFEYSIPVLAATDTSTDFGRMLEESGAGYWARAGDIDAYKEKLYILVKDADMRKRMGIAGRKYLEQWYDTNVSACILEKHFCRCNVEL